MRWTTLVVLVALTTLLIACEPEYVQPSALEPYDGRLVVAEAFYELDTLVLEHQVLIADLAGRIAASEEQLAFDITRAKRRLVGVSDSNRQDINTMLDVHEQNVNTESARARSRIAAYDTSVLTIAAEQRRAIQAVDPLDADASDLERIVSVLEESMDSASVEATVASVQEAAIRATDQIENELNKIRRTSLS